MNQVPGEIDKLQVEIIKAAQIYDTLNEFEYQFKQSEDADRRWVMFMAP